MVMHEVGQGDYQSPEVRVYSWGEVVGDLGRRHRKERAGGRGGGGAYEENFVTSSVTQLVE